MEHLDQLKSQIARYERLLENLGLDSRAAARVKVALRELQEELRQETTGEDWRSLRAG